ncbi:MAG: hypothetical protein IJU99_08640 [Lachnospiraceae bacterium]|nr:hypothetical protein [Lachnospiraceae bacterium]
MSKKCIRCGAPLPDEAHFCPVCTAVQEEKTVLAPERVRPRRRKWLAAGGLLAIAVILAILLWPKAKTYDDQGSAELVYSSGGESWHLVLRNSASDFFHWRDPMPVYQRRVKPGVQAAIPLQLYVYRESDGEDAAEEFLELAAAHTVIAEAVGDCAAADVSQPHYNDGFPKAMLTSDIVFTSECRENLATWTVTMKNGDTLRLHTKIQIDLYNLVTITAADMPLGTAEEVQEAINWAAREYDSESLVTLQLEPVTYEGDIVIRDRSVDLIGSQGNGQKTRIEGTVTVNTQDALASQLQYIEFVGSRRKAGVIANSRVSIYDDIFTECETGIDGRDGSWPVVFTSEFRGCGTGLRIDSSSADAKSALFQGNSFVENETGVQLVRMPGQETLYFIDCIFEGNGTDIDNQAGNQILTEW